MRKKQTVTTVVLTILAAAAQTPSLARDGKEARSEGTPEHASDLRVAQATDATSQGPDQSHAKVRFKIEAQPLEDALNKFAQQTGYQVLFQSAMVQRRTAPRIDGTITPEAALQTLLQNTQLRYKFVNPRTVTISTTDEKTSFAQDGKRTDGDASNESGLKKNEPSAATESGSDRSPVSAEEELQEVQVRIPQILVKAKKTLNADIERTEDDIQPYVVFTAEEIQRSMTTNLEDFFRSRLTMSSVPTTSGGDQRGAFSQNPRNGSNQSQISLRGLGVDETLILVNGRRRPGVSYIGPNTYTGTGDFGQPDINGIPLASIERVEVLPATAGGIYGGGATGGVINIILKTDYSGAEMGAEYANTFEGESGLKRITANGGLTFQGGRSSITFTASYSEQNPMFMRDRAFFQTELRNRQLSADPHAFENPTLPLPVGYTPNIRAIQVCTYPPPFYDEVCSPTSAPTTLRLKPQFGGASLGSLITHVPVGFNGNVQQLVANAGTLDLGLANDLANAGSSIINNPRTNSFNVTVNHDFTDGLSMYTNVMRSENHGSTHSAGIHNTGYRIAADAPTNPFDSPIEVTIPFPGYAFRQSNDSETLDALVGATLSLPFDWRAQLEGSWGRSRSQSFGGNPFRYDDALDSDGNVVREGFDSAVKRGAINVLLDTNKQPIDLSNYALEPYPNTTQTPSDLVSSGGVLRLSGPVARIPGGAVVLSALLERRKNVAKEVVSSTLSVSGENSYRFYPSRSVETTSYYLEASVPVISARNALAWVHSFDLQASVRRDKSDSRSVRIAGIPIDGPDDRPASVQHTESSVVGTGSTFGFRVSPVQDVTLRSSFSRGFLPPRIGQLSQKVGRSDISDPGDPGYIAAYLFDPQRGYAQIGSEGFPATVISEGRPDLKSETSRSVSAGMILEPRVMPGLRVSVDYTQIEKKNEVTSLEWFNLVEMSPEDVARRYPGRVIRAAPGPGDPFDVGPITFLDYSLINIVDSTVKAVDFQINYPLLTSRFGRFELYSVATLAKEMSKRATAVSDRTDSVGLHDGPLKWRGNVGIDWGLGALSLGWNMQFFDKQKIQASDDSAEKTDYYVTQQNAVSVPSQTYHDVSFRYEMGQGRFSSILDGVRLSGGVQNVFNTHPPIDVRNSNLGLGLSYFGDPRLRRYTFQVVKSF